MDTEFIFSNKVQAKAGSETVCPICSKKFYISSGQWKYKTKNKNRCTRWCCSYKCVTELKRVLKGV